ncbi:hypothetical protein CEXT_7851 [Caerostris extrusa]|uniref:Uncharacterized protein n=1 Tax=Caerostris extrusa TaxID=172846 RepID=A0AAV4VYI3_CAEEX|nr:hypothetical protein CEXT_7851 [Caerostris extrusa]
MTRLMLAYHIDASASAFLGQNALWIPPNWISGVDISEKSSDGMDSSVSRTLSGFWLTGYPGVDISEKSCDGMDSSV